MQRREQAALFLLRVGLGFFLLLWSCDKFAEPGTTVKIFQGFYKIPISTPAAYGIGAIEALISILIIAGAWKSYTYAIGLALHGISTFASWRQLTSPFSQGAPYVCCRHTGAHSIHRALHSAGPRHAVGSRQPASAARGAVNKMKTFAERAKDDPRPSIEQDGSLT